MRRLRNLLDGLPDEARCRRVPGDDTRWTVTEELLAQLIEEVSIGTAQMARDKPRVIPRPTAPDSETPLEKKHGGLFAAAMERGLMGGGGG